MCQTLIIGFYLISLWQMHQEGALVAGRVYGLWATVVVAAMVANILGSILTNIVLTIFEAIKTQKYEEPRFIADERDQLIELKGMQSGYITFSVGVLVSIIAFITGEPALETINMIIFFAIFAQIASDISRVYFYRRGF
jgi:hypothetical protein